jgi:hypothetical protein
MTETATLAAERTYNGLPDGQAAAIFFDVGRTLDTELGGVGHGFTPDGSSEFRLKAYGTAKDPFTVVSITPVRGGDGYEYQYSARQFALKPEEYSSGERPQGIYGLEKRPIDKSTPWQKLASDETIPNEYCQAVMNIEDRIQEGRRIQAVDHRPAEHSRREAKVRRGGRGVIRHALRLRAS